MFEELETLARRFDEIERLIQEPGIMADSQRYPALLRERGGIRRRVEAYKRFEKTRRELEDAEAIADDASEDAEMRALARTEMGSLSDQLETLRDGLLEALATEDENSGRNVMIEIRAGTGGDEAALFAGDLYRMYRVYAEAHGWQIETLDANPTDLGGFKEIILLVKGEDAWDRLRFEGGGHRVQRVPKTEAQGRIHTSAATVAIMPEAEAVEVDIPESDLEITVMRSQGPGGQSVNTTDSAVRVVHLPTGIGVKCQVEKSQHKNKAQALRILRSRLYDLEKEKADRERRDLRTTQTGSGDRSQRIRTYNVPQNRVTDHRLEGDSKNFALERVLEGNLDALIDRLVEQEKLHLRGGAGRG